ncbi:MAG: asparagine synthase (glutamine-hydrolyzing) [Proteobacteria bacterium]|nr:MAG: asparagine synthase (glutamine-hydrolyzing) [Pseudomonadota bacterium]
MCGIAGFLQDGSARDTYDWLAVAGEMVASLRHRGPDGSGVWFDPECNVVMAHTRLAIVDLTPAGDQPMTSDGGRYTIVFNGEIYNFRVIRSELEREGQCFRGHSDTEVVLAAICHWGIEGAVNRFSGMFAFAVWDRSERTIQLVRDRLGEKPLYYGRLGRTFVFGSELKALRCHPAWRGEIDLQALKQFMRYGYVPAPKSIYTDISKLEPGTILTLKVSGGDFATTVTRYWSLEETVRLRREAATDIQESEAISQLDGLLRSVIRDELMADVPLGAFLSGGVDSSTVVALMQAESSARIKTFTIGYHEKDFDESVHARAIARHLQTDHTELHVTPDQALAVVPRMPQLYDEPFADVSQIPTFLIAKLTRQHVTVSLSGDGGDEFFGGYNRYLWGQWLTRIIRWVPASSRRLISRILISVPPARWEAAFRAIGGIVPGAARVRSAGDKLHKLAGILSAANTNDLYLRLVSRCYEPGRLVAGGGEAPEREAQALGKGDFVEAMMYRDAVTFLPDDVLVKVDRATMGVSLESRAPLLDHRVVEFAASLPLGMKIREGQGKWLLRQVLYRYVPRDLIDRPKSGFGIPMDVWLRGPLRDWAETLLDSANLKRTGFLDSAIIHTWWAEHLSGSRNRQSQLWCVLMFQAWLAEQV